MNRMRIFNMMLFRVPPQLLHLNFYWPIGTCPHVQFLFSPVKINSITPQETHVQVYWLISFLVSCTLFNFYSDKLLKGLNN